MTPDQILERERRWARPVAVAAWLGVAAVVASLGIEGSAVSGAEGDAENLIARDREWSQVTIATFIRIPGLLLLMAPLVYLHRAADARSESLRGGLIGFAALGPLFLTANTVIVWLLFRDVAPEFVQGEPIAGSAGEQRAEDLIEGASGRGVAAATLLGGTVALAISVLYTSLHAMRTGLLTRFWGTLGMALGASAVILGFQGPILYLLAMGLLIAGVWPGGRPPAWAAGRAIPWPKPGEDREVQAPSEPSELRWQDPVPGDAPLAGDADEPGGEDSSGHEEPRPGSTQPRKRKRRT